MTDPKLRFDPAFKAREIAAESERFMSATVGFVMVKSAPWSGRPQEFGSVDIDEIHEGVFRVRKTEGGVDNYPDLASMLEVWIGD
jgi:hypothetical protein